MKTKDVSQRVEVDATLPIPVGSLSVRTSPDVTPDGDHVVSFDAEQVEDVNENVKLFTTRQLNGTPFQMTSRRIHHEPTLTLN